MCIASNSNKHTIIDYVKILLGKLYYLRVDFAGIDIHKANTTHGKQQIANFESYERHFEI